MRKTILRLIGGTLIPAALAASWLAGGPVSVAWACRTPVYRYALYHWQPLPYRVFYFYHGQPAQGDQEVNRLLEGLSQGEPPTNITLEMIDASMQEQMERVPQIVREAFKSRDDGAAPLHLAYTAWGVQLFAGRLDTKTVNALIDSPARKRIGELLQGGSAIVWVVLAGADAKETQEAEKVVAGVVADAAAGKLPIETYIDDDESSVSASASAPAATGRRPADDQPAATPRKIELGIVKLSRDDPAEALLRQMLLAIDPELKELAAGPMVFAIYGRGRVMPPLVGKGISRDQLVEWFGFLTGPCSCMVKEENPGLDLLMRWNWEAAAKAVAATDPDLREGSLGYEETSPRDVRGGLGALARETVATESGPSSPVASEAGGTRTAAPSTIAAATPAAGDPDPPESFAVRQVWTIGVALAVATLVVLAGGAILVRRRATG